MLCQLLDRISTISQDTGITIDISDITLTACGGLESGIIGKEPEPGCELAHVDARIADHRVENVKFSLFAVAVIGNRYGIFGHGFTPATLVGIRQMIINLFMSWQ
jgi:hypothetical protein